MTKALDQMLVLDLTHFEAGPACTELLAFLGADVIKIAPPEWADMGCGTDRDRLAADRNDLMRLNANKKSITLNLLSERGHSMFLKMVAQADVVIENYALGEMARLGLAYEVLKEVNPMIIYAVIKGFGTYGQCSETKDSDRCAQVAGEALSATSSAAGPPAAGQTVGETSAGLHAATGILAAYIDRMTHGRGQKVDVPMAVGDVDHPQSGKFAIPDCPVQLSESPVDVRPAPLVGQNNAAVYKHLLGLSEDDLQRLNAEGVV